MSIFYLYRVQKKNPQWLDEQPGWGFSLVRSFGLRQLSEVSDHLTEGAGWAFTPFFPPFFDFFFFLLIRFILSLRTRLDRNLT